MHFTFVIPAYNEEDFITKTLDSIYPQTIKQSTYSVLVVNNNSTDATKNILLDYIESNHIPNMQVLDEYVKGIIPARRAGVEKAIELAGITDHWLVNGDADVIYTKTWLQNLENTITANPNCQFIQSELIGEDLHAYPNILARTQPPKDAAKKLIEDNKFLPVTDAVCAYSASFYQQTGGYNREYYEGLEQMAETWRMYSKGKLLGFTRAFCHENGASHSNRRLKAQFLDLELGEESAKNLYAVDVRVPDTDIMAEIEKDVKKYITDEMVTKIFLKKIQILCFTGLLLEQEPVLKGKLADLTPDVQNFIENESHKELYLFSPGWVFRDAALLTTKLERKLVELYDR